MDQTVATAKSHRRPLLVTSRICDVPGVLTLLFILFWTGFSLYLTNPPAAVSANASANEFSSGRAMKHLQAITKQPHPPGTIEHKVVRDYIAEALRSYGVQPEIQTTTVVDRGSNRVVLAATIQNVIARMPGTQNSKALLVAGHYDTRPQAFGASDDGSGVVTMLESLRALKTGPPLRNDVIFLFSDAEEEGLLGASGFMEHPWARNVGLVLNFEARGSSGPSIMFETSSNNGWLIKEFAKAAPHPVANSLSYEVYKRLPNATDFTIFKNQGLDGLNFAYIDGLSNYHTPLDSIQRIDERSLQHHGSYALALTRHFGNLDLRQTRAANAVYFDLLGSTLIHYPYSWSVPIAILVLIVFASVLMIGLRKKRLTIRGVLFGFLAFSLTTAIAAVVAWLLWALIFRLRYASEPRPQGETYYSNLYLVGFVALTIAIAVALYSLFRRKTSVENLSVGGLLWWTVMMLLCTFFLPGGSYLFTWPLLFSVIGLAASVMLKERNRGSLAIAVLLVCAIPGLALMIPLTYQIFVGMTLNSIAFVAVLVLLQFGLLIPHFDVMQRANSWALPVVALLAGAGFIAAGLLSSGFDRQHPKPSNMFYAFNADSGNAVWASLDQTPDEWTSQFLSAAPQNKPLSEFFSPYLSSEQFRQNSAPATSLAPPQVVVLNDQKNGDVRTLILRVTSSRQAPLLSLFAESKSELLSVSVNGNRLDQNNAASLRTNNRLWNMRYVAPPSEGVEVAFEIKNPEPLKIRVVDQSFTLPQISNLTITRPDYLMPSPHPLSDATLVSKSFTF